MVGAGSREAGCVSRTSGIADTPEARATPASKAAAGKTILCTLVCSFAAQREPLQMECVPRSRRKISVVLGKSPVQKVEHGRLVEGVRNGRKVIASGESDGAAIAKGLGEGLGIASQFVPA